MILTINHALAQPRKKEERTRVLSGPQRLESERHCRTAVYDQWTTATSHIRTYTFIQNARSHTRSVIPRSVQSSEKVNGSFWWRKVAGVLAVSEYVRITRVVHIHEGSLTSPAVAGERPKWIARIDCAKKETRHCGFPIVSHDQRRFGRGFSIFGYGFVQHCRLRDAKDRCLELEKYNVLTRKGTILIAYYSVLLIQQNNK